MNYLELLQHSYKQVKSFQNNKLMGKLEYLSDYIFDFTTYENIISSMMAKKCVEVCKAISDKKTFEYIESEEGNLWYLIIVNMPFLSGKLTWGTSIRGAWWDLYGSDTFTINSCGFFEGDEQIEEIKFNEQQWSEFINAMIQFTRDDSVN